VSHVALDVGCFTVAFDPITQLGAKLLCDLVPIPFRQFL